MMSMTSSTLAAAPVTARKVMRGARRAPVTAMAGRPSWFPGTTDVPSYLDGSMPGDFGYDPLGLGADPENLKWFREAELQHARWAMVGAGGVMAQDLFNPGQFWYTAAAKTDGKELAGLLAFQIILMHWAETRRYSAFVNPGSDEVNTDPIFGYKIGISGTEGIGYPDLFPMLPKPGEINELKLKEIKNGRLAMVAFVGFVVQAQATGKGPLSNLGAHLAAPFENNIFTNFGKCMIPETVSIAKGAMTIATPCLQDIIAPALN